MVKDLVYVARVKISRHGVAWVEEPHTLIYIHCSGADGLTVLYSVLEPILTASIRGVDTHGGKYLQS